MRLDCLMQVLENWMHLRYIWTKYHYDKPKEMILYLIYVGLQKTIF